MKDYIALRIVKDNEEGLSSVLCDYLFYLTLVYVSVFSFFKRVKHKGFKT